jgi:Ca2+-binding EF-hand superfamily protein
MNETRNPSNEIHSNRLKGSKSSSPEPKLSEADESFVKKSQKSQENMKISETFPNDDHCIWHHQPLSLYCEVREEPLCVECLNSQYKGNQHKIISIDEAYRYRVASVYNTLSVHLFGRKEQLEAQARRVEFRIDELQRLKNVIERDMQSEFRGIFDRLNSSFNSLGGLVQSDIKTLEEDLEHVNFIIETLENSDQDFIKFLNNYKNVKIELEKAICKPFRNDIKVTPQDLPRELEQIRLLSNKCLALTELIQSKNEMIWKFLNERVPTCKISPEIEKELKQWATLAEKFSVELEKYNLKCDFCEIVMDDQNVNSQCVKNSSYSLSTADGNKYPASFKGNGRHFFVQIPKITKEKEKVLPKYADVDDKILQKISRVARDKDMDVERCFWQFDMLKSGFLQPTDFYYLMIEAFGLNGEEITELIFRFDPKREGRIAYSGIISEITAKLPEPFQKLRENEKKLLELCKKKDRLVEGAINQEAFKDVLRQIGLGSIEIEDALKIATKNKRGKIIYSEFHDKIL